MVLLSEVLSLAAWRASWKALGVSGDDRLHQELLERYREPQRKYHTLQHLEECFRNFADLRAIAERPAEIELALWFHDAIYEVRGSENEALSAELAHKSLLNAGLPDQVADRVDALIMTTAHSAMPSDQDAKILVDVDLWILASPRERFAEYEEQVRAEYSWVPGFIYRRKRMQVLRGFMARERIFNTELFFARYEQRARENLATVLT